MGVLGFWYSLYGYDRPGYSLGKEQFDSLAKNPLFRGLLLFRLLSPGPGSNICSGNFGKTVSGDIKLYNRCLNMVGNRSMAEKD